MSRNKSGVSGTVDIRIHAKETTNLKRVRMSENDRSHLELDSNWKTHSVRAALIGGYLEIGRQTKKNY